MKILKLIAIPLLFILYFSNLVPFLIAYGCYWCSVILDWLFDFVAWLAAWNTDFLPLTRASDDYLFPRNRII